MNLKESFRYQNFLDQMLSEAAMYLGNRGNITTVTETHLRSKANPDAQDETLDATPERLLSADVKPDDVVDFLLRVLDEKVNLSLAIDEAKKNCDFAIDAELNANRARQQAAIALAGMAEVKATERIKAGKSYKFNAEGNQMGYTYDVKEVTTIDYDRNRVKALVKKLHRESDEVSTQADRMMVSLEVDFIPAFDVNSNFEDAVEDFLAE